MTKEIFVERPVWTNGIAVFVGERHGNGKLSVMRPVLEDIEDGAHFGDPSLTLKYDEAQRLVDELWRCGLRPSEGTGSAGSLAATERHLKDMQSITRGLLKKYGVET